MDTKIFCTEEPIQFIEDDYPGHTGESPDSCDFDEPFIEYPYEKEGYTNYPCAWVERIEKGKPICDIDELVREILTNRIDRYDAAIEADWNLDRLIHIRLAVDLIMGEFLKYLKKKGVSSLGYRSIGTFSVEHLSFSGRLASEMIHNYEVLSTLPLTKKAFLQGEIMKSALRFVSRVMNPDNEKEWLSLAQSLCLSDLEREVQSTLLEMASAKKDAGTGEKGNGSCDTAGITQCEPDFPSEESDEVRKGVMMNFQVSYKLAPIWDFALAHFREKEHYSGPLSTFVEALCSNYITSGNRTPKSQMLTDDGDLPIFYRCHMRPDNQRRSRLNDIEPIKCTGDGLCDEGPFRMPWYIFFPPSFYEAPGNVREAAKKLIECSLMRQAIDVSMGKLLWAMRDRGLHRVLKCSCIEEYAIRYCDLSKPLLYRLMKLADGLERHPLIRDAFESGLISKEQARLILEIVDKKNVKVWIDYAAHVPTVTLQEEVERCRRILEYDCLAAGYYNILPGFRYITDERFHELPEDIQDIVRTGAWYQGSSMESSWPLEEDDEKCVMERDKRLEEPWKYFKDADEFLVYQSEASEMRRRERLSRGGTGQGSSGLNLKTSLCAGDAGQGTSSQSIASLLCAGVAGQGTSNKDTTSPLCALSVTSSEGSRSNPSHTGKIACPGSSYSESDSDSQSGSHRDSSSSSHSNYNSDSHNCTHYDAETLSKAREICTMPHDASPAETFLMDILADDSGPATGASTMSIRFFLPEELYELWNVTAISYIMQATAKEAMGAEKASTGEMSKEAMHKEAKNKNAIDEEYIIDFPLHFIDYAEDFLAALLQDYILTERIHLKISQNYAILKRDHFTCQAPGCKCRRNLNVHHIRWRSKGGGAWEWNLLTLCKVHHKHILHDLMALKIEGTAPHNLTFTFGPNSSDSDGPFLVYKEGRKVPALPALKI